MKSMFSIEACVHLINANTASGRDVSKDFQRVVSRRVLPDYYDIIKEPVALSTLRVSR
jgi:chromatin structure-remodeling complex subunit RSC1/2